MNKLSRYSFLVCALALTAGAFCYYPKWRQPNTEATLSWDVAGYYLYLPAVFIYGDLKKLSFGEAMLEKYHGAPELSAFQHPGGNRVIKYSSGQALQYLPWFLCGHFGAKLLGYPADGFSLPYQFAISMGSLLVAMLGLWFLRKILLRYFSDPAVAITLLLVALGTNYLEYTAFHGALTHNWLFTLYAILTYSTIRFYEKPSYLLAGVIGVLVGWAALTRPTDIIAAIIPLGWGIGSFADGVARLRFWRTHLRALLLAVGMTAAVGFIQLAYWKYVTGEWIVYSYQNEGFSWRHPHVLNGLVSYRAGWLIYSPVMVFAFLGFVLLARRHARLLPAVIAFCCLYMYITFAWDNWWYGGSLGQRAMVQSYPVWALGLAAFVEWAIRQKWLLFKTFCAALAGLVIWYNGWLTHQAHKGGLFKAGEMTGAYFWKILGKNEVDPNVFKLLDTDEEVRGERGNIRLLYANDFESDAILCPLPAISGKNSLYLDGARQSSPIFDIPLPGAGAGWVRVTADFRCQQKEWDVWKMTQLVVRYSHKGEKVKENLIRIYRLLDSGQTRQLYLDSKLPQKAFDSLQVFLWNGDSPKILLIDGLRVESFREY